MNEKDFLEYQKPSHLIYWNQVWLPILCKKQHLQGCVSLKSGNQVTVFCCFDFTGERCLPSSFHEPSAARLPSNRPGTGVQNSSFGPPPAALPTRSSVNDPATNLEYLTGRDMANLVHDFGANVIATRRTTYEVYQLKATIPTSPAERYKFYFDTPREITMVVETESFAEGGMRRAFRAHVVDSGGLLPRGTYVLKEHLDCVVAMWSMLYQDRETTVSKLCENVCIWW